MGRIHSMETMGLVDGPGIRFVVFFQGCSLRCAYCHNPDTWDLNGGISISPDELLSKILRYRPYFEKSGGGVTFSGGEPLLQPDFLLEILKLCKENGIHTAVDTAGFGFGDYDEILKNTDLVILDIKHSTPDGYLKLTGGKIEEFYKFRDALLKNGNRIWLRHVVVPGITDSKNHINKIKKIADGFNNVERIDLLPYHTMGVNKYSLLNIPYRLSGVKALSKEEIKYLDKIISA